MVIDGTINNKSESSKLEQKEYKIRYDWVEKVIYWELCKHFYFNYTNQWYMHKTESLLENMTYKLFWDFEIQIDRPSDSKTKKKQERESTE